MLIPNMAIMKENPFFVCLVMLKNRKQAIDFEFVIY